MHLIEWVHRMNWRTILVGRLDELANDPSRQSWTNDEGCQNAFRTFVSSAGLRLSAFARPVRFLGLRTNDVISARGKMQDEQKICHL